MAGPEYWPESEKLLVVPRTWCYNMLQLYVQLTSPTTLKCCWSQGSSCPNLLFEFLQENWPTNKPNSPIEFSKETKMHAKYLKSAMYFIKLEWFCIYQGAKAVLPGKISSHSSRIACTCGSMHRNSTGIGGHEWVYFQILLSHRPGLLLVCLFTLLLVAWRIITHVCFEQSSRSIQNVSMP